MGYKKVPFFLLLFPPLFFWKVINYIENKFFESDYPANLFTKPYPEWVLVWLKEEQNNVQIGGNFKNKKMLTFMVSWTQDGPKIARNHLTHISTILECHIGEFWDRPMCWRQYEPKKEKKGGKKGMIFVHLFVKTV